MANIEHVAQDADLTRKFHAVLSIRSVMAAFSGVYFLPTTICPIDLTSDEKQATPQRGSGLNTKKHIFKLDGPHLRILIKYHILFP